MDMDSTKVRRLFLLAQIRLDRYCLNLTLKILVWFHNHNMLRALKKKLLTNAFPKSLNIIQSDTCVPCNMAQEIVHLFFECPLAAYWKPCKLKLESKDLTWETV